MKKTFLLSFAIVMSLACFGHQQVKRESLNWRCDACHTAYKRVTIYHWIVDIYRNGYWHVVSQTKCPNCGR